MVFYPIIEVLWMELDLDKRSCQREKSVPKVFDSGEYCAAVT